MYLSIACPRVHPRRWWGFDQGGGQMYPKSPPGDRRNCQTTAPPCTRGDHSADWHRSLCPTPPPQPTLRSNSPLPGKTKRSNSPWSPGGGGGGGLQLIGALHLKCCCDSDSTKVAIIQQGSHVVGQNTAPYCRIPGKGSELFFFLF